MDLTNREITTKKITEIRPYKNNPRFNSETIELLKESIEEFGFVVPITVDKEGVIVTGHSRYFAARELGRDKVPVIVLDDLSEEKIQEFRLADNAVSQHTSFKEGELDKKFKGFGEDFAVKFHFSDLEFDAKPSKKDEQTDGYDMICPNCLELFIGHPKDE